MRDLRNGDIVVDERPRKMNKRHKVVISQKRYNATRKAPGPRVKAQARKKGQRARYARAHAEPTQKTWKTKREVIIEEDRENLDVDDLTQPTIHKNMIAPLCHF